MKGPPVRNPSFRLSATLPVKSISYLEWLGLEAKRANGAQLSKAAILRALVDVAMRLEIDVSGATTQEELEERIWEAMAKARWAMALDGRSAEEKIGRREGVQ